MEILNQVGGLMLGSVPTVLIFVLVAVAYNLLVRRPMEKTLAERRARTSGAVEQARASIAAAEAETSVFEDKLRNARAEILASREAKLQQWQKERDTHLTSVREAAQERVRSAKREIEHSANLAKQQIEDATAQLSDSILRAVLPAGTNMSEAHQQ